MEWWKTAVVYQVYPRSFQDSNADGIGDLPGITRRLSYLADTLGVDAVWLSPFYRSPMKDFGYDVADYVDVDPRFGTLDDFDALLSEAHRLGLKVIVDLVPNHTSDQHAWFLDSRSSPTASKRDWYTWRDPAPDGGPPNNWLSVFGGPAWTLDEATGQYYLHSFLSSQPDLNWRNPEVVEAMEGVVRFWLDRGVDGFRLDVAHFVMKDPAMRDNPPAAAPTEGWKGMGEYDTQIHLYDKAHPDVHEVFRWFRRILDGYSPERFAVGEIHDFEWESWARYYGEGDELHMPFNFSLLFAPFTAEDIRSRVEALEAAIPAGAWPNYVLGNHDEVRLATRYGADMVRAAAMLLLTLRGTPTLYYGDELAIPQTHIPDHLQQDPWGRQAPGLGRDGCRTPMAWDTSPRAGFTGPDPEPWLPLHEDWTERNVETMLASPDSVLQLYRRLLAVRRESDALRIGSIEMVSAPDDVLRYRRAADQESVEVVINLGEGVEEVDSHGEVLVDTGLRRQGEVVDGVLRLSPGEGVVLVSP